MRLSVTGGLLAVFCLAAVSQDKKPDEFEGKEISNVLVVGTKRLDKGDLRNLMTVRENEKFSRAKATEDLRRLLATGKFVGADFEVQNDSAAPGKIIVIFRLTENPYIADVVVEGAKSLKEDDVKQGLKLRAGSILNPASLNSDEAYVTNMYKEKGYYFVKVQSAQESKDSGVLLKWIISEGPEVKVESITFTGKLTVPTDDLEGVMTLKTSAFLRSASPFTETGLKEDMDRIKAYYYQKGYLDVYHEEKFNVFVEDLKFSPDLSEVSIKLHITEGNLYRIRAIKLKGNEKFPTPEFMEKIKLAPGDAADTEKIEKARRMIQQRYGSEGFVDARVEATPMAIDPAVEGEENRYKVDVLYSIQEGTRYTVGKVIIKGNSRTREDVIKMSFRNNIIPGQTINTEQIDKAVKSLQDRGWIEPLPKGARVEYEKNPDDPNARDVVVTLQEKSAGSVQVSAGYSANFGVVALFRFSHRNFDLKEAIQLHDPQGGGQQFSLDFMPAQRRQTYSLSFYEPFFFGFDTGYSLNLFDVITIREAWRESRQGLSTGFDKRYYDWVFGIKYRLLDEKIFSLEDDAPADVISLEGISHIRTFEPSIAYDTRDSVMFPSSGLLWKVSWERSSKPIGSDFNFNRWETELQYHIPIYKYEDYHALSLGFRNRTGYVKPFGADEDVPIFEKYFLGGSGNLRGFAFRGIGPRENDIPIGGTAYDQATAELTIPLVPSSYIYGSVFFDAGILSTRLSGLDDERIRTSAGVGIKILLLGQFPVTLDVAFALTYRDEDRRRVILFDLGRILF